MNEQQQKILNKIIAEEVQRVLAEEFQDPLAKAFLQPFADVIDTARRGLEKTTAQIWGNTEKLAKQFGTLLIPLVPIDTWTKEVDAKINDRLKGINSKYQPVIQRNLDNIRSRDAWGIPYLLNPALMTGINLAMGSSEAALQTLEALTGANPTITKMRKRAEEINTRVTVGSSSPVGESRKPSRNSVKGFREQVEPQSTRSPQEVEKALAAQIEKVASHPTIQNAIKNSQLTKQLQQIGRESLISTVADAINFNSYHEMKNKFASNPKFAQVENQLLSELPEGGTPEQVQQFKNALPDKVKPLIKQMYVQQLQKTLGQAPELSSIVSEIQAL